MPHRPMTPAELRAARFKLGLTQKELAARLEVHWTTVARWEGGRHPISKATALAIRALAPRAGGGEGLTGLPRGKAL